MIRSPIPFTVAAAKVTAAACAEESATPGPTPEERAMRRFPQPVRVGFLVGLPVLDERSSIIGRVRRVVRDRDGKRRLVVPHGSFLGFGRRLVAVPVELVAMLGAQVAAVDMPRAEFEVAPSWHDNGERMLGPEGDIRIGLTRR
jgi:hypothetical protein